MNTDIEKQEELGIVRIQKELHSRLSSLSKKKTTTMTALANKAIKNFLQAEEYTVEDLFEVIDKIPSLNIHKDLIKEIFEGCPSRICKDIIEIIRNKEAFFFEYSFDELAKKMISIKKDDVYGVFIHISMKEDLDVNKANNLMANIAQYFNNPKIFLRAGVKSKTNSDRLCLIVSYKKIGENKNVEI